MAQSRNEVLRRALKSWTENRGARPDRALVDRIVSTAGLPSRPVFRSRTAAYVAAAALAVAACLILAIGPWGWRLDPVGKAPLAETVQPAPGHVHDRLLSHALASATDATLDLARTTSGPAARLGRQVIEAATQAEPSAVMKSAADQSAGDGGYGLAALPSGSSRPARISTGRRLAANRGRRPCRQHPPPFRLGQACLRVPPRPVIRQNRQSDHFSRLEGSLTMSRVRHVGNVRQVFLPARRRPLAALVLGMWLGLFVFALAATAQEPALVSRELIGLVPPDSGLVLSLDDLRGQAREIMASKLAAQFQQLPAVKARSIPRNTNSSKSAGQIEAMLQAKLTEIRDQVLGDAVVFAVHFPRDGAGPVDPGRAPRSLAPEGS